MPITRPNAGDVVASAWGQGVTDFLNNLVPVQESRASGTQTLTTTGAVIAGMTQTISVSSSELHVIIASIDFSVITTGTGLLSAALYLDGAQRVGNVFYDPGAGTGRISAAGVWAIPVASGSRKWEMWGSKALSGGNANVGSHSRFVVIRFAQ